MRLDNNYDYKTHQHKKQLGDLNFLCDDVLGKVTEYLSNCDIYSIKQLSKSYLYSWFLERRYVIFKQKRKQKLNQIFSTRHKDYQYANSVFKRKRCVNNDCGNMTSRLIHFTDQIYYIPYCSYCWQSKILPLFI